LGIALTSIIFLTTYSGVPRTIRMAKVLGELGHKVMILEWDRASSKLPFEVEDNIDFVRMGLKAPYGIKACFLFPCWIIFVTVFLLVRRFDAVQPRNLDCLIPAWLTSRILRRRFRIVYDLADFYSDSYVVEIPLVRRLSEALEKILIKRVDGLITATDKSAIQIGATNIPENWMVLYNSPESAEYRGENEEKEGDKLSLFYGGIFGKDRTNLLSVIKAIRNVNTVEFLIAGFGEYQRLFENISKNLANVRFLGKIPHSEVMRLSSSADLIIIPFNSAYRNVRVSLPNKFFEAIALGKPLIVPKNTYMAELCSKFQFGISVDYTDIDEIKRAVLLLRDESLRNELSKNARTAYLQEFSWDILKTRLIKFYQNVLSRASQSL